MTTADILDSMWKRLLTVPNETFDLRTWREERKCGTIGCVIGHCWDLVPGLRLIQEYENAEWFQPKYLDTKFEQFAAIAEALNITKLEAEFLFWHKCYEQGKRSKYYVIKRLRRYAKQLRESENGQNSNIPGNG